MSGIKTSLVPATGTKGDLKMRNLDKALEELKYDVRMKNYNVNNGVISEQEMKKFVDSLPDSAHNCEKITRLDRNVPQRDDQH